MWGVCGSGSCWSGQVGMLALIVLCSVRVVGARGDRAAASIMYVLATTCVYLPHHSTGIVSYILSLRRDSHAVEIQCWVW